MLSTLIDHTYVAHITPYEVCLMIFVIYTVLKYLLKNVIIHSLNTVHFVGPTHFWSVRTYFIHRVIDTNTSKSAVTV